MKFLETELASVFIIEPTVYDDHRGEFFESYRADLFAKNIGNVQFIQDNESTSIRNSIRGLHYQLPPHQQAKLVRVIKGEVLDVVVDVRKSSPSFGKYISVTLSGSNHKQLYIPHGFAHGFLVKSAEAVVAYKVDGQYCPTDERGIIFSDPALNIDWGIEPSAALLSEKDMSLPTLAEAELFE